jgi:spore coat-associated protein N
MTATARSRRLLVPMATMLAAGAIALASGASFTSSSANAASTYATGTLTQSNSRANEAIFTGTNLKPGDTVTGSVTIENTGTLAADFRLTETATNGFVDPSRLQLQIREDGDSIFSGTFGTADTIDLGTFEAGESRTYLYTAKLAQDAPNAEQGRTASASYAWDAVQGAPSTFAVTGSD